MPMGDESLTADDFDGEPAIVAELRGCVGSARGRAAGRKGEPVGQWCDGRVLSGLRAGVEAVGAVNAPDEGDPLARGCEDRDRQDARPGGAGGYGRHAPDRAPAAAAAAASPASTVAVTRLEAIVRVYDAARGANAGVVAERPGVRFLALLGLGRGRVRDRRHSRV